MTAARAAAQPSPMLQASGARMTRGRRSVLDVLAAADGRHQSAEQILAAVSRLDGDVHRGSVYRVLEAFTASRIVHRVLLPQAASVYQLTNGVEHSHVHCSGCGSIADLPSSVLAVVTDDVARRFGFTLDWTMTALAGHCARCR